MLIIALLVLAATLADFGDQPSHLAEAEVISVARGASKLLNLENSLTRVAISDTTIANVVVVSPRELLVNGLAFGNTTLIVWDANNTPLTYTIEVSVDVAALNRQFATLFPDEGIQATGHGNVVVLSGTVSSGGVAQRMVEIARGTGATVIENFACLRPSASC